MKKYLFVVFGLCFFFQSYAQKFELNVDAYSGLFHYGGSGTASVSYINQGNPDYTNNPYGSKNGFSYGGGLHLQYMAKGGFIAGVQADYEMLRSKIDINGYLPFYVYEDYSPGTDYYYPPPITAKGQTFLQSQDINLSPYLGYRIKTNKIKIDVLPGIDLGFNMSAYDKGNATDENNQTHHTNYKLTGLPTDVRLRFGAAASYGRYALTISYAHGLTNLYKNAHSYYGDPNSEARSNFIRFGLSYRLF